MEEKQSKGIPKVLLVLASICSIILVSLFLLFVVNRFYLVVELQGEDILDHPLGQPYLDPGAQTKLAGTLFFRDGIPVEGELSSAISVDPEMPGEYPVRYDGSFYWWEGSSTRTVRIRDRFAPTITLTSIPGSYTIPGEPYQEEGYTAWDDCDGDLTNQVIRQEKDGTVTYSVTDRAGNRTSISRRLRYMDPIPPQLTLLGDTEIRIYAGTVFQDPGIHATDNCDGDISGRVTVDGQVDHYRSGTYRLTYRVRDSYGNETSMDRSVIVMPRAQQDTVTPEGKIIYLTFDDGPGPYTKKLLEILDKYNVKATFFVVNSEYIGLVKDMVEAGHSVGIHSMSHTYKEIYASADAYFADILGMQQIIYDECGVKTYLMRFPGGSSNTVSRFNEGIMTYLTQAVEDNGFRYFDWNVDSGDAGGARDQEDVFDNVTEGVKNRRVSIVLQHDIKKFSVEAVEKILIWGLENGYTFLPLELDSPTAHHGVNN